MIMRSMGEALRVLGAERVLIVHGKDGLDEASAIAETNYVKVWDGVVSSGTLSPKDFGMDPIDPSALTPGKTPAENAEILREAISDADSPRSKAMLPSASIAIWLAGLADDLPSAAELARQSIREGRATTKLNQLVEAGKNR
jgi:anthranilate phosphoribosyltransferase